jgi:hypothetical protein
MRKSYQTDEYDTTNENTKHSDLNRSTVNVPLNDSSKPVLRKGTPKFNKSKVLTSKAIAGSLSSSNLERAVFGSKTKSLKSSTVLDEFDDDDDDAGAQSNDTLLSDLPNDILSPEKHVYPDENLSRDLSRDSITNTILQRKELYPDLTKKLQASTPEKSSTTQHIISVTSNAFIQNHATILPHSKAKFNSKTSSPSIRSAASRSPGGLPETRRRSPVVGQKSPTGPVLPKPESDHPLGLSSPPRRVLPPVSESLKTSLSSKYESSDEEPDVPELTVKLTDANKKEKSNKRGFTENENHHYDFPKRSKTSLYPSLVPGYQLNESSAAEDSILSESHKIRHDDQRINKGDNQKSLYPELPNVTKDSATFDETTKPNGQSTGSNFNIAATQIESVESNPLHKSTVPDLTHDRNAKPVSSKGYQDATIKETASAEPASAKQNIPIRPDEPLELSSASDKTGLDDEELGDSDNWNKAQWKLFFKAYRRLKASAKGVNKDQIFNSETLKYLKCDLREIQLKIKFTDEFKDEIRSGKL